MHMVEKDQRPLRSGRLQLLPRAREVRVDGVSIPIGRRAFDILSVLVEARGELVTKEELLTRVWCGGSVEENALQAQISALRKALGSQREHVRTIAGRGYQFSGEATVVGEAQATVSAVLPPAEPA